MSPKVRTQADQRRDVNPRDQFGRKWLMQIEILTGDPTGGIVPAGWADPLGTPMQYLKVPRNADGQSELGRLMVDFPRWLQDYEEDERKWYEQLHINARDVYKRLDPSDIAKLDEDKFLQDLTGPKPWPSPAVIRKAQAGYQPFLGLAPLSAEDRAALGKTTLADMKAGLPVPAPITEPAPLDDTVPPDSYPQFISWVFRTKAVRPGDLRAAAELWKLHREALAQESA